MKSTLRNCFILFAVCAIGIALVRNANSAPKRQYKRVKPDVSKVDTRGVFFDDVFSQGLKGPRPANLGSPAPPVGPTGNPNGTPAGGDPTPSSGGGWSEFVSAQTIEDEIKKVKLELDGDVTTPTEFNGLGHKKCRKHFSVLGMLFAIANDYGGDVRWKEDAAQARDLFGKAGRGCKVATPASYNEAKRRKQDLADMVAGSRLQADNPVKGQVDWSLVCERSQLMKRIEKSVGRLRELTASASAFKSDSEDVKHEAEMLSAIAAAMTADGMPDGDDDDYKAFCDTMKNGGKEIVDATKLGNVEAASKAMGGITKACDQCHEIYRG